MKKIYLLVLFSFCVAITQAQEHSYVDLGLPSGTFWATENIGATTNSNGDIYQWGATTASTKNDVYASYYKFFGVTDDGGTYTDPTINNITHYTNGKSQTVLRNCDDVAFQLWGGGWNIPTKAQWQELIDNCTIKYGEKSVTFTGTNGNSINLPYTNAYYLKTYLSESDYATFYWTSDLDETNDTCAYVMKMTNSSQGFSVTSEKRYYAMAIRPVLNHRFTDGICTDCGAYEEPKNDKDDYGNWLIENKGQLYWYANYANNEATYHVARAILQNDITVNSNLLDSNHKLNYTPSLSWTPIGTVSTPAGGSFDGQGHTISGLYINLPNTDYVGFFANLPVNNGGPKNLTIKDSYIVGHHGVGALAGYSPQPVDNCHSVNCYVAGTDSIGGLVGYTVGATISNCSNSSMVYSSKSSTHIGGILGWANGVRITDCTNSGTISCSTSGYSGGIVGYVWAYFNSTSSPYYVQNCTNSGSAQGGIIGWAAGYRTSSAKGTLKITKCINTANCPLVKVLNGSTVTYCGNQAEGYYLATTVGSGTTTNDTINYCYCNYPTATAVIPGKINYSGYPSVTASYCQGLATGEACYNMETSSYSFSRVYGWYQKIGTDNFPSLDSTEGRVYQVKCCANGSSYIYSNSSTSSPASNLTYHAAVSATCTNTGTIAYYECKTCGKLYTASPSTTSTETTSTGIVTAALGHSYTYTNNNDGKTHKGTCSRCSATVSENHSYSSNVCSKCSDVGVTGLTMNATSATLWVNGTKTLTATIAPTNATVKTITWSSSDTSVATVSTSGVVTAKAKGTATITATSANGTTATCSVTVKQQVTAISLSATSATLWVGKTQTLTATATPTTANNTGVTWSSSNTSVATVSSSGVITAVAKGTATITCTAADGYGTKKTCAVTVNQQVTSISLSATSATLWVGKTQTLTATATPTTANNTGVTWSSSNTSVATVSSSGVITAVAKGTATITCTAADGYGAKKTCAVTVKQQVTAITLSSTSVTVVAGETATITATATPTTASSTAVNWTTSNSSVATVSGGTITAVGAGTATITATAADGYGTKTTCAVTVIARGDVDGSGVINNADVAASINYVLGDTDTDNLYADAADYNNNGKVTSTDVVAIVRLALNGTTTISQAKSGARRIPVVEGSDLLAINDMTMKSNETKEFSIGLTDTQDKFTSVMFDFILPEGVILENVTAGSRLTDHSVVYSQHEDGTIRVMCYSMNNENLTAADGDVVRLTLKTDGSAFDGVYDIPFRNINLVRKDISSVYAEQQMSTMIIGDASSIASYSLSDGKLNIGVAKGALILTAGEDGMATVFSTAGALIYKDSIKSGSTVRLTVPSGVYLVNGTKVVVK